MQYEILVSQATFNLDQEGSRGADGTLERKVEQYIADGWRPQGGVSSVLMKADDNTKFAIIQHHQAMIKG